CVSRLTMSSLPNSAAWGVLTRAIYVLIEDVRCLVHQVLTRVSARIDQVADVGGGGCGHTLRNRHILAKRGVVQGRAERGLGVLGKKPVQIELRGTLVRCVVEHSHIPVAGRDIRIFVESLTDDRSTL